VARLGIFPSVFATTPPEVLAQCRAAETVGLASVWGADAFDHDCFVDAAVALSVTETMPVGIAIAMPVRTPLQTAKAAAQLAEFGARFTLGLGAGHSDSELKNPVGQMMLKVVGPFTNERGHGIAYSPPVERMREYHACVTSLLRAPKGELVEVRGEYYSVGGNGYGFDSSALPVVIGGTAPRMVQFAGEAADGLVVHLLTPREIIAKRVASARAVRTAPFMTAAGVEVSVDPDERVALRRARAEVGAALQIQHFVDRLAEVTSPDLAERVVALVERERYEEAANALPEEVVRSYVLVSTPKRFAEDVAAFAEVDQVLPLPVGQFLLSLPGILGTSPEDADVSRELLQQTIFGKALQPA
jgi:5,10-methylenetetrahydromethanopterin reductase